jgi:hypothetical protein
MESQSLLESLVKEVRDLHDCLDEHREEEREFRRGIESYFIGMKPENHIRHHNDITDEDEDKKEGRRMRYEIYGGIVLMVAAQFFNSWYQGHQFHEAINEPAHIEALKEPAKK